MSYQAYVDETGTDWNLTFRVGGSVVDITGAVVELVARKPVDVVAFQDASQFAIVSGTAGTFTFSPVAGDVDSAGIWMLQPFASVDGQDFAGDPIEWHVGP